MTKPYKILVVCSANKGRSASYHAHMQHMLDERGIRDVAVDSAGADAELIEGLHRDNDTGANPVIKDILEKQGVEEINRHMIKPVTPELLEGADLVLTYNTDIRNKLHDKYPEHKEKIHTVRGYTTGKEGDLPSEALDVDDAFHPNKKLYRGKTEPKTYKAYAKVCDESKRLAERTLEKLLKRAENE